MLAITLGIITALVYGFADFFGALASRRLRPILVTGLAGWAGLLGLLVFTGVGLMHANFSATSISNGLLAGLFSAFGLACLYQALAIGPISILSPTAAVVGAVIPAMVGTIFLHESFKPMAWLAIGLVLVATVLVAYHPNPNHKMARPNLRGILFAIGAGVGIGAVLIFLHATPAADGVAAVILMRAENAIILGAVAGYLVLTKRENIRIFADTGVSMWVMIFATGVLDATANALFVWATTLGSLTVVSVLTSLYPLGTILLARLVLKEKLAPTQALGIGLALAASALLAF